MTFDGVNHKITAVAFFIITQTQLRMEIWHDSGRNICEQVSLNVELLHVVVFADFSPEKFLVKTLV